MRLRLTAILILIISVFAPLCAHAASRTRTIAERDFQFARELQQRGFDELAVKEYIRFITKYKGHQGEEYAWLYMIESYKSMGDKKSAARATDLYNKRFPNSVAGALLALKSGEEMVTRADELLEESKAEGQGKLKEQAEELYDRAADSYTAFLKSDLTSVNDAQKTTALITALFKRAYCYERLEKWNDAIKDYEELAEKYTDYEAQFKAGDVYYRWALSVKDAATRERTLQAALKAYRRVYWFGMTACYDDAKIGEALARIEYGKFLQERYGPETKEGREALKEQLTQVKTDLDKELGAKKFDEAYQEGMKAANTLDKVYLVYLAPQACIIIAECFEIEGDKENAVKWLRYVPKNFPKSEFRAEAQKRISKLVGEDSVVQLGNQEEARRTLDLAIDAFGKKEYEKAFEGLMKLKAGYPQLRLDPMYKEYLMTLMNTCFASKRYLLAGAVGEHLAGISGAGETVTTASGESSVVGDALYMAGSAYWDRADEMPNSNKDGKAALQTRAVRLMERLASQVPSHIHAGEGLLLSASYHLDLEHYEEAARSFTGYLVATADPKKTNYEEALYNLAYCYLSMEDYEKAAAQYERYISLYNGENDRVITAVNMLGACRLQAKDYNKAIVAFKNLDPKKFSWVDSEKLEGEYHEAFSDAPYMIARAYYDKGDMKQAAKEYESFFEKYPDNKRVPKARLELGQLYFDRGEHEKVVAVLNDFIANHKDQEQAYLAYVMLVESYVKTNDVEKALSAEAEMFRNFGKEQLPEGAYGKMAKVMKDAGQADGASLAYRELISDYKDEPEVLQRGLWAGAEHSYETLEALENEIAELKTRASSGNEEKLDELNARATEYRTAASRYYGEYIRVGEAILKAKKENKLPARYFQVQLRLASLHEKLGEYKEAEKAYNAVAAKSGDEGQVVEAQYRIGFMWLNAGDLKKAKGSLLRIVFFPPEENEKTKKWIAYSMFEAGRAYMSGGEMKEAEKMFADFLAKYGEDAELSKYSEKAKELLEEVKKGR